MSQNPARSRPVPAPSRVSGGIPWWLWLILIVFGGSIVKVLISKAIPEDPRIYVQEGMAALEEGNIAAIERSVLKLKEFPEHAAEQKLLEGLSYLGKSKPLLAIPFLLDASKEPAIRVTALTQLGNAYMRSRQRVDCIAAYESALKEDENADDARLNLAYVFKDMISWDDALKHLTILVERKFKPDVVHQMMAEIYADLGRYEEAAAAFEAAMIVDPTNPTNAAKSSRMLSCRIETGDLEGVEEILPDVDAAGVRESARALILAAKGETKQALSALDQALQETPNDSTANLTYGRIMAGIRTKEKAIEALTSLKRPMSNQTRNLKLYEVVAELATIAEKPEIAATAQQNVDQLKDLESQFSAKLAEVIKTHEGTQDRIALGDLAAATGHFELARAMYQAANFMDSKLEGTVEAKIHALFVPQPPLVQLGNISEGTETGAPADRGREVTPGPGLEPIPEPAENAAPKPDGANPDDTVAPSKPANDAPDATSEPLPN